MRTDPRKEAPPSATTERGQDVNANHNSTITHRGDFASTFAEIELYSLHVHPLYSLIEIAVEAVVDLLLGMRRAPR